MPCHPTALCDSRSRPVCVIVYVWMVCTRVAAQAVMRAFAAMSLLTGSRCTAHVPAFLQHRGQHVSRCLRGHAARATAPADVGGDVAAAVSCIRATVTDLWRGFVAPLSASSVTRLVEGVPAAVARSVYDAMGDAAGSFLPHADDATAWLRLMGDALAHGDTWLVQRLSVRACAER